MLTSPSSWTPSQTPSLTPFLSGPQLTLLLRAAPLPLPVKEQILDQLFGHHDDLYTPATVPSARRSDPRTNSKQKRIADARLIGGFIFRETLPSGDAVYDYCKNGELAYEVVVRAERPVHCSCPDFRFHVLHDPEYYCKHCLLFVQQDPQMERLIAESARSAATRETAWAWLQLGRITDEQYRVVSNRAAAARAAVRKVVQP